MAPFSPSSCANVAAGFPSLNTASSQEARCPLAAGAEMVPPVDRERLPASPSGGHGSVPELRGDPGPILPLSGLHLH